MEKFPVPKNEVKIKTTGPALRFGAVLFIEKEGFNPILEDAGIAEKYDIAIMSTKGLPVAAACRLTSRFSSEGIKIFVLHDFDLAGFKIVKTLRQGTRLAPGVQVVDIGFRLGDVDNLQSEQVVYKQKKDPRFYLRRCGATEEECAFLVSGNSYSSWYGGRVELNAMTSDELIDWLERKFKEHGVSKLVPDAEMLSEAYQRAIFLQKVDAETEAIRERIKTEGGTVPDDLARQVTKSLEDNNQLSWDMAVWDIASSDLE